MIVIALIFLTFVLACIVFALFDEIMKADHGKGLIIAIKKGYKLLVDIYNMETR